MKVLKYSRQREAIKASLMNRCDHPTADALYASIREEFPNISLGTVYRNLVLFQQQGLIQSIGVVKGQERFDGCIAPHSHLICTCCGAVMDLPHPMLDDGDLDQTVSAQYGFLVQRHELIFYGTCENCQNKIKQEEKLS